MWYLDTARVVASCFRSVFTMKEGDMVRFAKWEEVNVQNSKTWANTPKNHLGILVEHDKLMGLARVLHNGELYNLRAVFVQKAGKKDFDAEGMCEDR